MLRSARSVMVVLVAMFVLAAPSAMAQSPLGDQYTAPSASGGSAGAGTSGAPVQVREIANSQADKLPFTGGQISLIAVIGLSLLAIGAVGVASTRRRASATTA